MLDIYDANGIAMGCYDACFILYQWTYKHLLIFPFRCRRYFSLLLLIPFGEGGIITVDVLLFERCKVMNRYRNLSILFIVFAVILLAVMCVVVTYNYTIMLYGVQYGEFSAPASTAFLLLIPFGLGIIICLVLAHFFSKKKAK